MKYNVPLELSTPDGWTCDDVRDFVESAINNERNRRGTMQHERDWSVYNNLCVPGLCCVEPLHV